FVQLALLEADRANVKAAPLLDELGMDSLDRGVEISADAVGVAPKRQPNALDGQPHHHVPALVECGAGREVRTHHAVGILLPVGAADNYAVTVCHPRASCSSAYSVRCAEATVGQPILL